MNETPLSQEDNEKEPNQEELDELKSELDKSDEILKAEGLLTGIEEEEEEEEDIEEEEQEDSASPENQPEEKETIEEFNPDAVKRLIESGVSDEEIWEKAKEEEVFPKHDGSSYYVSEHLSNPKKGEYYWRRRSAAGNTSGSGYRQKDMFENYIQKALDKYREEMDNTEEESGQGEPETGEEKIEEQSEKDAENSEGSTELEEEPGSAGDQEVSDSGEPEDQESVPNEDPKDEPELIEETPDISAGDLVYLMEGELQRWRDPKEVIEIHTVKGEKYVEVEGGDGLYPLEKLKLDPENAEYKAGPGNLDEKGNPRGGEITASPEDFDNTPMPEELMDVPGAEEIAGEFEKMSPEERENISWGLHNIGYKVEELKGNVFKSVYGFFNEKFQRRELEKLKQYNPEGYEELKSELKKLKERYPEEYGQLDLEEFKKKRGNSQSTMARWFSSLTDQFDEKAKKAQEAMAENQQEAADKGVWDQIKSQAKDKWKLTANALKLGGAVALDPRRWVMWAGLALSTGAEAGKEARFKNEELTKETRLNAEAAAEEAWTLYNKVKDESDKEVAAAAINQAYLESIPADLLKRLDDDDVEAAHAEAREIYEEAASAAEGESISADNLQAAFEKLTNDPEPGQNSAFVGGLMKKQIERLARKLNDEFYNIDTDDNLSSAEKTAKKQKILQKWGRSQALQDYDRMLTTQGRVDGWAMSARYAEKVGKGITAVAMVDAMQKAFRLIPGVDAQVEDFFDSIAKSDDLSNLPEATGDDTGGFGGDSLGAETQPEGIAPFGVDTTDTAATDTAAQQAVQPDTTQTNPFETGADSAATDSADVEEASSDTTATDTTQTEGQANPFETGGEEAAQDTAGVGVSYEDAAEVGGQPETAEALGGQTFEIDESGEGMIAAIADKLEDEYGVSHEKAMDIGNRLFIKGEQLGGEDELFNLVGKGDSFELDFGDLSAADLQEQSTDQLIETIDFDQSNFTSGDSGVTPDTEIPENTSTSGAANASGENVTIDSVDSIDVPNVTEGGVGPPDVESALNPEPVTEATVNLLSQKAGAADKVLHEAIDSFIQSDGEPSYTDRINIPDGMDKQRFMSHIMSLDSHQNLLGDLDNLQTQNPDQFKALQALYEGYFQHSMDSEGDVSVNKDLKKLYGALYDYINTENVPELSGEEFTDVQEDLQDEGSIVQENPTPADEPPPPPESAASDSNQYGENPIDQVKEVPDVSASEEAGMTEGEIQDFQEQAREAGVEVEGDSNPAAESAAIEDRPIESVAGDEALREAVDKVPESHLRGKVAYSAALIADDSELVANLPETRINVLSDLLERWAETPTSQTIEKIGETDPRLLTVLERALTADHIEGDPLSPNDQNVLAFTRKLVSQLSADDFANGEIPPYAQESIAASRQ